MTNKNKTISFRVKEDKFTELRALADDKDIPLSRVFRDYVDELISHDGKIKIVPKHEVVDNTTDKSEFPPTVEVPKALIREHERLELENEHLREQLNEYKQYVHQLEADLDGDTDEEEIVSLEEFDAQNQSETFLSE